VILFFKARRAGRALESLRKSQSQAVKTDKDEQIVRNYQLIVDTIDRSNVMLWWAHVTRNGDNFDWNFRKPLQLNDNPIMRLASLADKGWMWGDDQAPDHREAEVRSRSAIVSGKPGYQQEFRIIGPDGVHWLSEEVFIRPDGEGQWNLAGVVTDVTRRHQAEEARMLTEVHLDQILKGADCILFQAIVTGDPDGEMQWSMFIPPPSSSVASSAMMPFPEQPFGPRKWFPTGMEYARLPGTPFERDSPTTSRNTGWSVSAGSLSLGSM